VREQLSRLDPGHAVATTGSAVCHVAYFPGGGALDEDDEDEEGADVVGVVLEGGGEDVLFGGVLAAAGPVVTLNVLSWKIMLP
jgi:hypothetical protein